MEDNVTTNTTDGEFPLMRDIADALDKISVWFSLLTGIPGNIFIFLTMRTFPTSVATFHFQLLAVMDTFGLCMQLSIRGIDWYGVADINKDSALLVWKIFFNIAYYASVYANWVLVYIAVERLIALRYPASAVVYLTVPRAKANAVLTGLLMASFCGIVTVKMSYFGLAWLVVFTTFYTAFPVLLVFVIIWLLLGTMEEQRRQRKKLEKEKEKHHHHHHHAHTHSHKDAQHVSVTGVTPTAHGSHTPLGGHTPVTSNAPTMTKSISGLSKHSATSGMPVKHDMYVHGPASSASRQNLTLTFTTKVLKSASNTTELDHETQEAKEKKAKEKRELEQCYTSMMLVLSVTFVVLTIPYTVIEYVYVSADRSITDMFDEKQAKMYLLIVIGLTLMFVEHSCNFYLFFLFASRFRRNFLQLFQRRSPDSASNSPSRCLLCFFKRPKAEPIGGSPKNGEHEK